MASTPRNPLRGVMEEQPRRSRRPFQFVGEVIGELNKVTWPTREDAFRLSLMVISVAVVIGAILAVLDFAFNSAAESYLR
jgi:preprotein translocase SecE subunit